MGFPVGLANRLVHKEGRFGHYEVRGDLVVDSQHNEGWYVELDGIDSGTFAIVDGTIHPSGRNFLGGPNGSVYAPINPEIAELSASAKQAIIDAIATWDAEEANTPRA